MTTANIKSSRYIVFGICLSLLLLPAKVFAKTQDSLHVSGFARVVLGYLDESNVDYLGYENKVNLKQQSLFGLQADYQFNDYFSATAQAVARAGGNRDSELAWLYFTFKPKKYLNVKFGRQRTPLFTYSDIIDVGFAYSWASLPQQVYNFILFPSFDGINVNYEFVGKAFIFNLEGYYGNFHEDIRTIDGTTFDTEINNLSGVIGNLNYGYWEFRASYHKAYLDVKQPELFGFSQLLRENGFIESADSIISAGDGRFYQISLAYEDLDLFVRSEFTRLENDILISPDTTSYFISTGYNFDNFTVYTSYAKNIEKYSPAAMDIPVGLSPQLDELALGYQQIFQQLPIDNSKSLTLGMRFDWKANLAFKLEASKIEADQGSRGFFLSQNSQGFDGKGMLYQAVIEWVF